MGQIRSILINMSLTNLLTNFKISLCIHLVIFESLVVFAVKSHKLEKIHFFVVFSNSVTHQENKRYNKCHHSRQIYHCTLGNNINSSQTQKHSPNPHPPFPPVRGKQLNVECQRQTWGHHFPPRQACKRPLLIFTYTKTHAQ